MYKDEKARAMQKAFWNFFSHFPFFRNIMVVVFTNYEKLLILMVTHLVFC